MNPCWALITALGLGACMASGLPQSATNVPATNMPATNVAAIASPIPQTPKSPLLNARAAGVTAGPDITTLPISEDASRRAIAAFRLSCPALLRRVDQSQLTQNSDWAAPCAAAETAVDARNFFVTQFETIQVGDGVAFATGYYEPEIAGSRFKDETHQVPVFPKPADLIEIDLGKFSEKFKDRSIRGRSAGGTIIPYFDRGEIDDGALTGRTTPIAWAADYIDFFVLQIQGSGRLRLPDGSVMQIGYAGQNGRDYTGIGALMRDRGLLGPSQRSMQGIMAYLRANPEQGMAIMRENKSYVFFREIRGPGPLGSLDVAITPRATVATDPAFVPLGAPVWLDLDRAEADGLWVAQDVGGAIKGSNRFDTFWGAGDEAFRIAGGMSGRGNAFIVVPRGTLARLTATAKPQ